MNKPIKPIPEGFHSVTAYLTVKAASQAIEFYKRAFGAQERFRMTLPDGKSIGHAEIVIGDSIVMLADEFPGCNQSPQTLHGTPVGLVIYMPDVDAAFQRALDAGATVKQPLENKFYGDRAGTILDPFGHQWSLMMHVEDVAPEELNRRMKAELEKMGGKKKG